MMSQYGVCKEIIRNDRGDKKCIEVLTYYGPQIPMFTVSYTEYCELCVKHVKYRRML